MCFECVYICEALGVFCIREFCLGFFFRGLVFRVFGSYGVFYSFVVWDG